MAIEAKRCVRLDESMSSVAGRKETSYETLLDDERRMRTQAKKGLTFVQG